MRKLVFSFLMFLSTLSGFCSFTGTTQDGDWSDAAIWLNGILPDNVDTVFVGHRVILDVDLLIKDNQLVIITNKGILCGNDYSITLEGYSNATLINNGYIGVGNIYVEGTFINNGITYSNIQEGKGYFETNGTTYNYVENYCPTEVIDPVILQPLLIELDTITLCNGENINLDLPYSKARYYWNDGTENSAFSPVEEGLYYVDIATLTDTLTDSVYVLLEEGTFVMPNIFTPNGDGNNDDFLIEGFDLISLRVYNRWGKEILESTDLNLNYTKLNDGVYYYVLEHNDECLEENPVKGWVQIAR